MQKNNGIVLNIPHSSLNGFTESFSGWEITPKFIDAVINNTDLYTDLLFSDTKHDNIISVVANLSKFIVDMQRGHHYFNTPTEYGILHTELDDMKRNLDNKDTVSRLIFKWHMYQSKLLTCLDSFQKPLLINCHSFSSSEEKTYDVEIGYNDDWSKPDDAIITIFKEEFELNGYSISIIDDFSIPITPKSPENFYKSIFVSVCKSTYMNEETNSLLMHHYKWSKMTNTLKNIYEKLLTYEQQ